MRCPYRRFRWSGYSQGYRVSESCRSQLAGKNTTTAVGGMIGLSGTSRTEVPHGLTASKVNSPALRGWRKERRVVRTSLCCCGNVLGFECTTRQCGNDKQRNSSGSHTDSLMTGLSGTLVNSAVMVRALSVLPIVRGRRAGAMRVTVRSGCDHGCRVNK